MEFFRFVRWTLCHCMTIFELKVKFLPKETTSIFQNKILSVSQLNVIIFHKIKYTNLKKDKINYHLCLLKIQMDRQLDHST